MNRIGRGQYIAFAEWFACRDERESMWRLSRITTVLNKMIQFTYIGEFQNEQEIVAYITAEANA